MIKHNHERAESYNFSLAFEQMCSFVAIADTQNADETLRQLILQCFVVLSNVQFQDTNQLKKEIDGLFGIHIPTYQVQNALDRLLQEGTVQRSFNGNLALPIDVRTRLQRCIDEAISLEHNVKQLWIADISTKFPNLSPEQAWLGLRGYLARAFRRHGIMTAALLDPTINVASEYSESLSSLLEDAIKDYFSQEQQVFAREVISSFLASVRNYPDRATYIAQLGNGAFNYFSLTVAPEIAEQFKKKLYPLTLFLDTNFLFGILDLHVNSLVETSKELLQAVEKNQLPFKLRYHQVTERELRSTITRQMEMLSSRNWPQSVSRAAITSPYISGIELRYHQLNAKNKIDFDSFLKLYGYVDVLLKDKNIDIYRTQVERLAERACLFHEYQEFLDTKDKGKEKTYEIIDHDITLLDTVRQLRSNARSSLEAGALLVTCDSLLYRFDWETSRSKGRMACVVLPNLFLQLLRPFLSSDTNFDQSFAETFAVPEFRTVGNGAASKACSRMLSYFALYQSFPEETAKRMLSNSLLIDKLRTVDDEKEFQGCMESALAIDNLSLLEDKIALEKQLEQERIEKANQAKEIEQSKLASTEELAKAKQIVEQGQEELKAIKERNANLESVNSQLASLEERVSKEGKYAESAIKQAEQEKVKLEKQIEDELLQRKKIERIADNLKIMTALLLSLIIAALFEFMIRLLQWHWLLEHPNSYGLQIAFVLILCLTVFSFLVPKWRKWCWSGGIFAIILIIIQILGGPVQKH